MSNFSIGDNEPNKYLLNLLDTIEKKYGNNDGTYLNTPEEISIFVQKAQTNISAGVCKQEDLDIILKMYRSDEVFEYDDKNRIIKSSFYNNSDDKPKRIDTFEYYDDNKLKKYTSMDFDEGIEKPVYVEIREYDSEGNKIRHTQDDDGDGIPESIEINGVEYRKVTKKQE